MNMNTGEQEHDWSGRVRPPRWGRTDRPVRANLIGDRIDQERTGPAMPMGIDLGEDVLFELDSSDLVVLRVER